MRFRQLHFLHFSLFARQLPTTNPMSSMRCRNLLLAVLAFSFLPQLTPALAQQRLPPVCRNPYTQQKEIELGDKVVQQVYATMPVLPDTDPVAVFVRQLGAKLVAVAPLTPGLDRQWPFNFHVVASGEINAFALPGGTMFVNLGAVQAAQTEAQLAGVMAHEMSHVILRHSTCNLVRQQHRSVWYSLGQIGSELALGGVGGDLAAQGLGYARSLSFLKMSRGDERQADMLGVQILYNAGFDPRGLPQFFEVIESKDPKRGAEWLSDHPNPGNRTEYLDQEIATMPRLEHPVVSTPAFTAAHREAAADATLTAAQIRSESWKSSGQYARGPGAPPATAQTAAYTNAAGAGGAAPTTPTASIPPLSSAQLGLASPLRRFQLGPFALSAPAGWTESKANDGGLGTTLAPSGGVTAAGTAYGVVLGSSQQGGGGVSDPQALQRASDQFAARLQQASGLTAAGPTTTTTVAGQPATSRYLQGTSPVAGQGGAAVPERDWLVTVARSDGDMDTLIFVAPATQFEQLDPLFHRMLATFQPQ